MYGIIYLYKQNLMNVLSKLQILASRATIGVPVSFLLSSFFFFKKMVLNYGYIQGVPNGRKRFSTFIKVQPLSLAYLNNLNIK